MASARPTRTAISHQKVSSWTAMGVLVSVALFIVSIARGYPLYAAVLLSAAPLVPLAIRETARAYRVNGWLATFGVITVLQIGHLGEHTVQVLQLIVTGGELEHSHGVFGQLDFETVHFLWDTGVWAGALALLWRFGRTNPWLWVSLLFASLHQIEHIYLFSVYLLEPHFHQHGGGAAGILGRGGLLPTVERPYLHFAYNFLAVAPLVLAFVTQLRSERRLYAQS